MSIAPQHYDVIVAPVVTEKSTILTEHNQVVFEVRVNASKREIKTAIEALFDVTVTAVNTIKHKGKTKRFRGISGRRKDIKKAIVTLNDGDEIDIATGL